MGWRGVRGPAGAATSDRAAVRGAPEQGDADMKALALAAIAVLTLGLAACAPNGVRIDATPNAGVSVIPENQIPPGEG